MARDRPWYRYSWPWIFIGLFAAALAGGVYTIRLALRHGPGGGAEGSQHGLIVTSPAPPVSAQLVFDERSVSVRLPAHSIHPQRLYLIAVTQPQSTRYSVLLRHQGDGYYQAGDRAFPAEATRFILEPPDGAWQLATSPVAGTRTLELTPVEPEGQKQ